MGRGVLPVKIALIVVVLIIAGIGAVEVLLRVLFGFGKPPLYLADTQTGYRLMPNQRTRRFGNELVVNQYSMRGTAIAPLPTPDTLRVLMLGDSITNGGWWTDQAEILSVKVEQQLAGKAPVPFQQVEVLNASANSWGPRNELAFVAKFGTFGAQQLVLVLNTDDLFATAPTSLQVGRDLSYPDRYPPLALVEVLTRLRKPRPIPELEAVQAEGGDRVGANLAAIQQLQTLTQQANCQFLLVLTPLLREVLPPGPRDYELKARQRLWQLTQDVGIPAVDFLESFTTGTAPQALYRDHIHLSAAGNAVVSEAIAAALLQQLSASPTAQLPDSLLDDPW
jgi:hypothetical protein